STPRSAAASRYQSARQLRQKPARIIRSMFCTSLRSWLRCFSSRRNAAASSSVRSREFMGGSHWVPACAGMTSRERSATMRVRSEPASSLMPDHTPSARILDGRRIADDVLARVRTGVQGRVAQGKRAPGLAVVLVGADPASNVYVKNKRRACRQVGFKSFDYDLPADTQQQELYALIDELNADPSVHGILVQLPLPEHINASALIDRIESRKDVDGFSAVNLGHLALRRFGLRPC